MNVLIAYSLLFFGLGLNYLFSVVVARALGVEVFGDYSYALYIFNILSLVAVVGLDEASIKFLPQSNNSRYIKSKIQTLALIAITVFFSIYLIIINTFLDGIQHKLSMVLAFSLPLFVMLTVNSAILQANYIVGQRMIFRYVLEPVTKIGLLLFFIASSVEIFSPVYAMLAALFITNIAMLFMYREKLLAYGYQPFLPGWTPLLKFVAPMSLNNIINIVSSRMDLLILGVLATSLSMGHYSAAFQTAAILSIVLQGMETVYAPIFSKSIGEKNFVELDHYFKRALRLTIMISSPVIIIFILYPEVALLPFGNTFQESINVLAILAIGQLCNLATGSANTILISIGRTKIVLINSLIYGFSIVISVYVGVQELGILGAAIGVSFSVLLINSLRVFFLYKISGVLPFSIYYAKSMIALVIVIVAGYFSKSFIGISGVLLLPIGYLFILMGAGIHPEDKAIAFKIRNMIFQRKN